MKVRCWRCGLRTDDWRLIYIGWKRWCCPDNQLFECNQRLRAREGR